MITYRLAFYQAEPDRARELIEAIKRHPGSCDTVWLTSMGYYPALAQHETYAKNWVPIAKMFRDAGIKVSMQIANTIGHGDWDQLRPEKNDPFIQGMLPKMEKILILSVPTEQKILAASAGVASSLRNISALSHRSMSPTFIHIAFGSTTTSERTTIFPTASDVTVTAVLVNSTA